LRLFLASSRLRIEASGKQGNDALETLLQWVFDAPPMAATRPWSSFRI
jgi:hypothetical protein